MFWKIREVGSSLSHQCRLWIYLRAPWITFTGGGGSKAPQLVSVLQDQFKLSPSQVVEVVTHRTPIVTITGSGSTTLTYNQFDSTFKTFDSTQHEFDDDRVFNPQLVESTGVSTISSAGIVTGAT